MKFLQFSLFFLFSAALSPASFAQVAETATQTTATAGASPSMVMMQTLLGLIVVVGVIFLLAWLAKKLNLTQLGQNRGMKVVATLPLSAREKVVLIEIGGEQILLGVAPGRVNEIHHFSEPVVDSAPASAFHDGKLSASSVSEFSKKLNEFISQGNKTR